MKSMKSALTTSTDNSNGNAIKAAIFEEIEAVGAQLSRSVPGFSSLWLVGAAADSSFDLAASGSAWLCSSELSFVLISEKPIPAPTLRCMQAGIGLRIGGLRIRLRHFKSPWLAQQASKHREGFELLQGRRLLAGEPGTVLELDPTFLTRPSPASVENLCVDTLELLLRAYPGAPMLERSPSTDERTNLVTRGGLTEAARNLGDAVLLLAGTFTIDRESRRELLAETFDESSPVRRSIYEWAFSPQPLIEELPLEATELWTELRAQLVELLRCAVEARLGRTLDRDTELLAHVRNCRRGLWSRAQRFFRGKQRVGGREYFQLLLMLTLLADENLVDHKSISRDGARLLSLVGGPILANPDWGKMRREALLVEPWQHLLRGAPRGADAELKQVSGR